MPKTFAINSNNDIFIDQFSNLAIHTDLDAVIDTCKNAVQTLLGEMIYQTNQGMPNFQTIWGGNANIPQFRAALVTTIQAVEGVQEVFEVGIEVKNNELQYTAYIVTDFGVGEVSNV